MRDLAPLGTLEVFWNILSAVIQQQVHWDGDIKNTEAKNIGLHDRAKANSSLKINKFLHEAAARSLWWRSQNNLHQVSQQVSTHPKLKGVGQVVGLAGVFGGCGLETLVELTIVKVSRKAMVAIAIEAIFSHMYLPRL